MGMKRVAVYGAGQYARDTYQLLKAKGEVDRIAMFVVSSMAGNMNELFGIPVFQASDVINDLKDSFVYLAISPKNSSEVIQFLERESISNFAQVTRDYLSTEYHKVFLKCCNHPVDRNKVFFDAFNGLGYRCNCKYIAEEMIRRKEHVSIVWNTTDGDNKGIPGVVKVVKEGTPDYFMEIYTSGVVVYNNPFSSPYIEKRKEQYYIFTWHGIGPFKKVAYELIDDDSVDLDLPDADLMLAGSEHCEFVYRHSFRYTGQILRSGYPRNDVFWRDYEKNKRKIRRCLGVDDNKLVVLYAPTFRYNMNKETSACLIEARYDLRFDEVIASIEKRFNKRVFLLFRLHHRLYETKGYNSLPDGIMDVTFYPDMQELLVAADVLITDYSSSMWDFSLSKKPVFLYFNDKEECENRTGFYRDPDTYPYPKGHTTEELCEAIENYDDSEYQKALDDWFFEYGSYDDGHASERVVNRIMDVMKEPNKYEK